jgi:DNA primase
MMLNSVTDEIKSRVNIVDFIGQYLKLTKAGANWKALCPFHNEKTPSFMVHEEKQIWHCFGCGKGGDIFGFLMEMEGVDFKEALKIMADRAGVQLKPYQYEKDQTTGKNKILEILELAAKFYEKQLWDGAGKKKILPHLRERGLRDEIIREFRVGYAPPGWRNLLTFLTGRGYKTEEIAKTGLLVQKELNNQPTSRAGGQLTTNNVASGKLSAAGGNYYDRFRDRITFPIADIMGKVVGFSARVAPGGDETQAKYVNTPETAAYHKSRVLYGIDKAKKTIKEKNAAVVMEGNTDVIASYQAGLKNAIGVCGTALTAEQIDIIRRYASNVILLFDSDSAGEEATARSAELCFQKGISAFISRLEGDKDAAEMAKNNPQKLIESAEKTKEAAEYLVEKIFQKYDAAAASGKKRIFEECLNLLKLFSSEVEKNYWAKKISQRLEIPERAVFDSLRRADKRFSKREEAEKPEDFFASDRAETILEKIAGLMLSFPSLWREMAERFQENSFWKKNNLMDVLLTSGGRYSYQADNLLLALEDEELRKLARSLVFKTRFHFENQNEAEESSEEEARSMLEKCVLELEREQNKKKLEEIAKDIRKAEQGGKKEELKVLMNEFLEVSKKLKN